MLTWKRCTLAAAGALMTLSVACAEDTPLTLVVGSTQSQAGTKNAADPASGTGTSTIVPNEYWLGVVATRPSPALQAQLSLPQDQGLLVEALQPESPAVKAGLRQYDILLKGNDKPLSGLHDLMQLIEQVKDEKLTLELLRAGKHETVTVTPAKRPASELRAMARLPLVFDLVRPGQILPPGSALYFSGTVQDLADGSMVEITGHGAEPAKVVVTHGKDKWEGTSADLSKIPEMIRPEVEKLLHAGIDRNHFFARTGAGTLTIVGDGDVAREFPGPLMISPDVEKRLRELQKQLDELRQSVDAIQGKAKEKSAAKPE